MTVRENCLLNSFLATTDTLAAHLNTLASKYGEMKSRFSFLIELSLNSVTKEDIDTAAREFLKIHKNDLNVDEFVIELQHLKSHQLFASLRLDKMLDKN